MTSLATAIGYGLLSARPAAGTPGSLYYATDSTTLYRDNGTSWDALTLGGGGSGGGWTQIGSDLALGGTASGTFSSIPGTYHDLQIEVIGASAQTGTGSDNLHVRCNGDTTSGDYQWSYMYIADPLTTTPGAFGGGQSGNLQTAMELGTLPQASIAGGVGVAVLTFYGYALTSWHKPVRAESNRATNDGRPQELVGGGLWLSTAAITSVTLLTASGSNFATNSVARLYGRA